MSDIAHWRLLVHEVSWAVLLPGRWNCWMGDPFWRCYHHDRAGATLDINGVPRELHAGAIYLIPAHTRARTSTSAEVGQFYCHFSLMGISNLMLHEIFNPLMEIPPSAEWARLLAGLCDGAQARAPWDIAHECQAQALIFTLLAHVLESMPTERLARYQHWHASMQPILPALRYIDAHLAEPITLARLADTCTLSPIYFGRRFHGMTGRTPIRYIQELRVNAAAQLLVFSNQAIEAIALQTGFGDRAYFSRIFTRLMGQSPAAYRRLANMKS